MLGCFYDPGSFNCKNVHLTKPQRGRLISRYTVTNLGGLMKEQNLTNQEMFQKEKGAEGEEAAGSRGEQNQERAGERRPKGNPSAAEQLV